MTPEGQAAVNRARTLYPNGLIADAIAALEADIRRLQVENRGLEAIIDQRSVENGDLRAQLDEVTMRAELADA